MIPDAPRFGLLLFPRLTQLDLTGPFEVLARVPGAQVHLIWKTLAPVASDTGLRLLPTATFADCPELDLLLVPGGAGVNELMTDRETLDFLRGAAERTPYLASVCTGALVLGAAGILKGRRAATHWASRSFLEAFGAVPVAERVVVDGSLFTGGGVTAGIDIALRVVGELLGETVAGTIELSLEYDPQPPYGVGSPERAGPDFTGSTLQRMAPLLESRAVAVRAAASALNGVESADEKRGGALLLEVVAPALGRDVDAMLLVAWRVEPGGRVTTGEPLFDVETDKAVFEVEAEAQGVLAEVLVPAGEKVAPGTVVARIRPG